MKYYEKIMSKILAVVVAVVLAYGAQAVLAVDPEQVTDCVAPTSLDAYVNPLGLVNLKWLHGGNTTEFIIQVLPAGQPCGSTNVEREITIPGTASWYVLPTDLTCGFKTLCIKARCCNDRCDACQNLVGKDEDYCTAMSRLYTNSCACKQPGTIPVAGSFRYKCVGSNGQMTLSPTPCLIPSKQIGCTWDCNQAVSDGGNKACGVDYEVKCGTGPHGSIVNSQPSYDLCSVFDSRGYKPDDSYVINPPAVFKSPLESRLLYQWGCMGAKPAGQSSCFACRRAICGEAYQNQVVGPNFANTDPNKLCASNGENTATATKPVYNPATKQWEWDCIGNEKCGTNRNGVLSFAEKGIMIYDMAEKCTAQAASCGWADKQHVTYETWQKNGGSDAYYAFGQGEGADLGDFWCANGGRVQNNGWEKSPIHTVGGAYNDTLSWRCVYGQGAEESAISCSANLIKCRTDMQGKNFTKASFAKYKSQTPNLCDYGKGLFWPFDLLGLASAPSLTNNRFAWECKDKFQGVTKCSANEVACQEPPTGTYVSGLDEIKTQKLCTYGTASQIKTFEPIKKPYSFAWGYWQWDCTDDFGYKALSNSSDSGNSCQANKLDCGLSVNNYAYSDWADFKAETGVSCGAVNNDKATCTGVCNKSDQSVVVTFNPLTKRWSWTCGLEACQAKLADCNEPPHQGMYKNLEDFVNKNPGVTCDMSNPGNGVARCCGVCSQQGADCSVQNYDTGAVNVTFANNKFTWNCGAKSCEAQGKCQPVMAWADEGQDEYCAEKLSDQEEIVRTFTISGCSSPMPFAYLINTGYNNGTDNTGLQIAGDKIQGQLIDEAKKIWRYTVRFRRQGYGRSRVDLEVGATCNDSCAEDVQIKYISDHFAIIANRAVGGLGLQPTTICSGSGRALTMSGQSEDKADGSRRACANYEYTWTYTDALGDDNAGGWLKPNQERNYRHIFARLMPGSTIKAQVRCADEDKCVDESPAGRDLVVQQSKVAQNVRIIGEACSGEPLTAEADSPQYACTKFKYRWTVSKIDGSDLEASDWSAVNNNSYPASLRAAVPGDKVVVEAKCAEEAGCVDEAIVSAEKLIRQKVKAEAVSIKPQSICAGNNRELEAVAVAPGCNRVEYRWQVNSGWYGPWSTSAKASFNALAGDRIKVSARCADVGACVDNAVAVSSEIVVNPAKTLNLGEITGYDQAICQQDIAGLSLKANVLPSTSCANISYAWYLNDDQRVIATTKDLVGYNFPVGAHRVKLQATCNDTPCGPEPKTVEKTVDIQIDPKVDLTMSLNKLPNVEPICAGKEVQINCEANGLPEAEKNKLLPIDFVWTWNDSLLENRVAVVESNPWLQAWKLKFKLPEASLRSEVKSSCSVSTDYRCAETKSLKIEETVPVIACGCGVANNSKHTAAYWQEIIADKSQLCQNGGEATIVGDPASAQNGRWTWSCKYPDGTESLGCSATEVTCGDLGLPMLPNNSVSLGANKYTPANWNNKLVAKLCVAGKPSVSKINDVQAIKAQYTEVVDDYPDGIQTARRWLCAGDSESEADRLSCGNWVVDCGWADANRYVTDAKRITPKTGAGALTQYHASFNPSDGGVPVVGRCINSTNNSYVADGQRGAYTWNCGVDSDGVQTSCAARKDCGWTAPNGQGQIYPTVYYNSDAGCWTAENIKNPDNANQTTMAWHRAVGILDQPSQSEPGFFGTGLNACGRDGCTAFSSLLGSYGRTCPAGWSVPVNSKWNKLEDLLDTNTSNNCVERRFPNGQWQCNPAGANNDPVLGFGLKSPITFNGRSGEAYWLQTGACTPADNGTYNDSASTYCVNPPARTSVTCVGSSNNSRYLSRSPFYVQLRDDSLVGRLTVENWCQGTNVNYYKTGNFVKQLRCVKTDQTTSNIILPPPTTTENPLQACVGLGCYRRR